MIPSLPDSIRLYFDFSNGSDTAHVAQCFTQDAVVVDEGQTYRGHDAIESWNRESRKKYAFTVEPVAASGSGERLTIAARVVGNFPGSPVQLDHVFDLAGDRISALEIR